jgi:DNA-binding cell septation regulator SpoVG
MVTLARPETREANIIAYASIQLDHDLRVSSIRVVKSPQDATKRIVAMPSRLGTNGVHRDVVYPIRPRLRAEINDKVLAAVDCELGREFRELTELL